MPDKKTLLHELLEAKIHNTRSLEFPEPIDQAVSIINAVEALNRLWKMGRYPQEPRIKPQEAMEIIEQKLMDIYSGCEIESMLKKERDPDRKQKALDLRSQIGRDMDDWHFLKNNNIVLDS